MKDQQEVQLFEVAEIQRRIMSVRSVQVMLDRDLAELYGVELKALNQAVKRNAERFPERFMYQLTKEEFASGPKCSRSRGFPCCQPCCIARRR